MPHIHEKIDFVADVFVVNGNAVLLRKHDKYKIWLSPGGHIELDEDPNEAALREVKEEVGLDVHLAEPNLEGKGYEITEGTGYKELLPPRFMNIHSINDTHKHISFVYFATVDTRIVTQGETEISDEIHWFTKEELDDPSWGIKETIKHYAKTALEELGS